MNPQAQAVQKALALMEAKGIGREDALEILAAVAEKLQDQETIAKARRTGMTPNDVRGAELGREVARRLNAKNGRA